MQVGYGESLQSCKLIDYILRRLGFGDKWCR